MSEGTQDDWIMHCRVIRTEMSDLIAAPERTTLGYKLQEIEDAFLYNLREHVAPAEQVAK